VDVVCIDFCCCFGYMVSMIYGVGGVGLVCLVLISLCVIEEILWLR